MIATEVDVSPDSVQEIAPIPCAVLRPPERLT